MAKSIRSKRKRVFRAVKRDKIHEKKQLAMAKNSLKEAQSMDTSDEGSMAPSAAAAAGRAKNTADKLASGADTTPVDEAEGSDVEAMETGDKMTASQLKKMRTELKSRRSRKFRDKKAAAVKDKRLKRKTTW